MTKPCQIVSNKCSNMFNRPVRCPYGFLWIRMDPYVSVWSLSTPWGLPGAFWDPGSPKTGVKGFLGVAPLPVGPCCGSAAGCCGFLLAYHRNPYGPVSGCCGYMPFEGCFEQPRPFRGILAPMHPRIKSYYPCAARLPAFLPEKVHYHWAVTKRPLRPYK